MLIGPSHIPETVSFIIVMLHGFGSNGEDMFALQPRLTEIFPQAAIYAPNAPDECVGNPFGGYQWFELPNLEQPTLQHGLEKVRDKLSAYLSEIAKKHKLTTKDVVVMGFSQGCMIALDQLFKVPLKAVIGMSGGFIPPLQQSMKVIDQKTPTLLVHGTRDMVVPHSMLQISIAALSAYGVNADQISCDGLDHAIDQTGFDALVSFIKKSLNFDNVIHL